MIYIVNSNFLYICINMINSSCTQNAISTLINWPIIGWMSIYLSHIYVWFIYLFVCNKFQVNFLGQNKYYCTVFINLKYMYFIGTNTKQKMLLAIN